MNSIAAAVVLYNPSNDLLENIESYSNQVELVYVVDNSENQNIRLTDKVRELNNVKYIWNGTNLGIAGALNVAGQQALGNGFSYLLTMDQDSKASDNMVEKLHSIILSSPQIGIVAAEHFDPDIHEVSELKDTKEVLFTMTSGNLLNLIAFKTVGGFLDELFIDHVDHEFCLRLKKNSFITLKTNETFVFHKLGKAVKKKLLGFTFCPSHHPPVRLYYRTRNRFFINKSYKAFIPEYVKIDNKNFIRELVEIFLFENELLQKSKMIIHGYIHYRKKIMGKYIS